MGPCIQGMSPSAKPPSHNQWHPISLLLIIPPTTPPTTCNGGVCAQKIGMSFVVSMPGCARMFMHTQAPVGGPPPTTAQAPKW